jgi:hypothetical protein
VSGSASDKANSGRGKKCPNPTREESDSTIPVFFVHALVLRPQPISFRYTRSIMKVACLAAVGAFAGSCEAFVANTAFSGSALLSRPASTQQATSTLCMMARTPIITGNWKMNPGDMQSAVKLAQDVSEVLQRCLRCKCE